MTEVQIARLLIHLSIGFVMVCFGISQFIKPKIWLGYIPKWLAFVMPIKSTTFMREHALGNFFIGLLFMIGVWPMVMAWIAGIWWLSILPFALLYDKYIGLRDLAIIMAIVADIVLLHTH
jgi:hypothetical protein